jgi:hypothetical protein
MDSEEMAKKCDLKSMKTIAKKYGINICCAKKLDLIKALPPEVNGRAWGLQGINCNFEINSPIIELSR